MSSGLLLAIYAELVEGISFLDFLQEISYRLRLRHPRRLEKYNLLRLFDQLFFFIRLLLFLIKLVFKVIINLLLVLPEFLLVVLGVHIIVLILGLGALFLFLNRLSIRRKRDDIVLIDFF